MSVSLRKKNQCVFEAYRGGRQAGGLRRELETKTPVRRPGQERKIYQITVMMEKSVEIQKTECLQTVAL